MASPNTWSGGLNLAGTPFDGGPSVLELAPSYFSGLIQFLDDSGNDANAGSNPELPVATLAQAVTNSAANGLIIVGQNHAESLSGSQAFATAGIAVIGCGVGSSRPRFTCTGAVDMFAASAAGIRFINLYFPASTAAATARIAYTSTAGEVAGCYFECGTNDTNRALRIHTGAHNAFVRDCQFVTTALRPAIGLEISAAVTDARVEDCTFDGGSYGWTDYAFKVSAAATRIVTQNITLSNQSDFGITVTATSYQLFGVDVGGVGRTLITA